MYDYIVGVKFLRMEFLGEEERAFTILIDTVIVPSTEVIPILTATSSRVRE